MSGTLDDLPPQAIILTGAAGSECASVPVAQMDFQLSLGDVMDANDLIRVVAVELMFPHEASGFDALLDLMSDLDWFGNDAGYVVELHDFDQLAEHAPELLDRFVALLPNLCDRWRSRGVPFRLILRCDGTTRRRIRTVIDAANAELQEAAVARRRISCQGRRMGRLVTLLVLTISVIVGLGGPAVPLMPSAWSPTRAFIGVTRTRRRLRARKPATQSRGSKCGSGRLHLNRLSGGAVMTVISSTPGLATPTPR